MATELKEHECQNCKGTGKAVKFTVPSEWDPDVMEDTYWDCEYCKGKGKIKEKDVGEQFVFMQQRALDAPFGMKDLLCQHCEMKMEWKPVHIKGSTEYIVSCKCGAYYKITKETKKEMEALIKKKELWVENMSDIVTKW